MRLLLDSHILLWALAESPRLKDELKKRIRDPINDVLVSAASVWEITIKRRLGRLQAPDNWLEFVEASDFAQLAINFAHAVAAGNLPRHHDDPFDRMLVAQAQTENLVLVTSDRKLGAYQVQILSA